MKRKYVILYFIVLSFNFSYPQEVFEGYTLFTPQTSDGQIVTYLIDVNYNVINFWEHTNGPASMAYLIPGQYPGLENALLLYPFRVDNPTMQSGGVGGGVQCLSWSGEILWEYILANENFQHHHDIEPLPNGNVLLIAWEKKTDLEAFLMGREEIDNPLNQMWSSAIFEISPNNSGGAEVVWEWHLWDHLVQDFCSECPNYGNISDHPELFNINNGNVGAPAGPGNANADWIHLNAIDYHEDWDQIVISSRYMSEIFVIDHSTTTEESASHSGGRYGKGGDFLYRWGNPQNYNRGSNQDKKISNQHSINWIPKNSPGENNFILFNNYHSGSGPFGSSAVLEFILPVDIDGNYSIEDGQPFGPADYLWSYEGDFFSAMQGGSFRQPNGNTLITDCDSAYIFEVSEDGEIVWTYEGFGANNIAIARAQKYPIDFFDNENNIIGDLNGDYEINILDIVLLVNQILSENYILTSDINNDGLLNILDIVLVVNLILDN